MIEVKITTSDLRKAVEALKDFLKGELICVVGPSSSGKSLFSKLLAEALNGTVLSTDDFYLSEAWRLASVLSTFDHPSLIDWDLLIKTVKDSLKGKDVEVPIYDMRISSRIGYRRLKPKPPIVLEGIFASYGPLNEFCEQKIAIDSPIHLLMARRMIRDPQRALEAPSKILDRVVRTVLPFSKTFVEPQMREAKLKVVNVWRPELPYELRECEEEEAEEGYDERRIFVASYSDDKVYMIENIVDSLAEHYVLVSWENKYIGARVLPDTAYFALTALAAHGFKVKGYYQRGRWNEDMVGVIMEEVTWKRLGSERCCKLCIPLGLDDNA